MESFRVVKPSVMLAPYIRQYWFLSADKIPDGRQRIVPSGSMGLVFNRGEKIYLPTCKSHYPVSYLSGQTSSYMDLSFSSLNLIIVVFEPMGARAFLNMPMDELNGLFINLFELGNPLIKELSKRIAETVDNKTCVQLIEMFLSKCFVQPDNDYHRRRIESALSSIRQGESDIKKLAKDVCLSYKQFQRVFSAYTGLNPKEYIKINRFAKALYKLKTEPRANISELADECGYYDKSHLIKDMRAMAGYTPAEFISTSDPHTDYKSLFQSVCINIK